jgi:uncharacterized protein YgiM (DUF1202 family)
MKIWIQTSFIGFCICLFGGSLILAEGEKATTGIVTAGHLNIRGRPLNTAELCGQLEKGDMVQILERKMIPSIGNTSEEWVRIVLPEKSTVWVQSNFIGEGGTIQHFTDGRAGPSPMWPVLCKFTKGDVVNVKTNHNEWSGIVPPPSASAWVSGLFVSNVVDNIPVAPAVKEEPKEQPQPTEEKKPE